MAILTLQDTQLAYGELPLLDRAALAMESGKRLGLVGRNGTGKSSLLGAIAGRVALDDGELRIRDGLRIAMIEQEPVLPLPATLKQSLLGRASVHQEHKLNEYLDRFGLNPNGAFRPEWERAAERGKRTSSGAGMAPVRRAERRLGWAYWPLLQAIDNEESRHKESPRDG